MARLNPIRVTVPTAAKAPRPMPPTTVWPNLTSSGPTAYPAIVSVWSLVSEGILHQVRDHVLRLPHDEREQP